MPQAWKQDILGRLMDHDGLRRMDKRYETDDRTRFVPTSKLHLTFLNAIPRAQLPVSLRETDTGKGVLVTMDMPESFRNATTTLGLRFENLSERDEIQVAVNGARPPGEGARGEGWTRVFYQDGWNKYPSQTKIEELSGETIEYDVTATDLRRGVNQIEVRLASADSAREENLVLQQIRVDVHY